MPGPYKRWSTKLEISVLSTESLKASLRALIKEKNPEKAYLETAVRAELEKRRRKGENID